MAKAIAILLLGLLGAVGYLVYQGYQKIQDKPAGSEKDAGQEKKPDAAKTGAEGETAGKIFEQAGGIAQKGVREAKELLKTKLDLKVSPMPILVQAGGSTEARISRGGTALPALKLTLVSAEGSGLKVSGGEFAAGQKDAVLRVEAPESGSGRDASIALKYEDYTLLVPVRVK